nr:hypothetical protein CFP56_14717 [Quercus suber]
MTFWGIIIELPNELRRKSPVVILLNLSVKLFHPPNLDEELGEVSVSFLIDSLLNTVSKLVVAVLSPKFINGIKVWFWDELGLREEHIAAFLCSLTSQDNEETPGFFVSLFEVLGG